MQRNRFVYTKEHFFESKNFLQLKEIFSLTVYQRNVSLIQRNYFLGEVHVNNLVEFPHVTFKKHLILFSKFGKW